MPLMERSKLKLILLSSNNRLCAQWKFYYENCVDNYRELFPENDNITINHLEIQNIYLNHLTLPQKPQKGTTKNKSVCFVSPANLFGDMRGGYDTQLLNLFNIKNQTKCETFVKREIEKRYNGYLPSTRSCQLIEFTKIPGFRNSAAFQKFQACHLMMLPTMRIPEKIQFTEIRKYYEFIFDICWQIFSVIDQHNMACKISNKDDSPIGTIVLPGFGTGYGCIETNIAAKAMIYSCFIYFGFPKGVKTTADEKNKFKELIILDTVRKLLVLRFFNLSSVGLFYGENGIVWEDLQIGQEDANSVRFLVDKFEESNDFNIEKDDFDKYLEIFKKL